MNSILKRIAVRLRVTLFPSDHDKEVKKWFQVDRDESLRYDYDLTSESLIIDLGGYKGQWASDIYARFNCRVLVFEPVQSFADKIKRRFERNSNIEVFSLALGESSREEEIALSDDGTSLFAKSLSTESIFFEDVTVFFKKHNIDSVDLMKINIEGGEYELMPSLLRSGLINKIKNIQIQFHNVSHDSEYKMNMICNELSKTHRPTYQSKFVWENWVRHDH